MEPEQHAQYTQTEPQPTVTVTVKRSSVSLLWGAIAILAGLVLMIWPQEIIQWTIRLLGILLLLIGVVQFLGFLVQTRGQENRWQYLPTVSVISLLGGALLLLMPEFWAGMWAILCGVLLILLALMQIVSLVRTHRHGIRVAWGYYIFPLLLMGAGGVVVAEPLFVARWLVVFVGAWVLAYGIVELFEFITLRR